MIVSTHENSDWETAVGRLIVAFGQIEYGVYAALKLRPALNLSEITVDISLSKKIEIALEIIRPRIEPEFEEVKNLLLRAKKIVWARNLIAHNPLIFDYIRDGNDNLSTTKRIASLRDKNRHITLDQLVAISDQAYEISEVIWAKVARASVSDSNRRDA